jgi:hypothetical protein
MKSLNLFYLLVLCCLLPVYAFALSGVPSLDASTASIAYAGPGVPTLLVTPDGSGNPFTEAQIETGNPVDATVTLYLRDGLGSAIVSFPWEDIWLEADDDGLVSCTWGVNPDHNTDQAGMTQWISPAEAAGYSESVVRVIVNGSALTSNNGLPLNFNSPDINADGIVNLSDISGFTSDFYSGQNSFRSDFFRDGVLNLSDIYLFAVHFGATCP